MHDSRFKEGLRDIATPRLLDLSKRKNRHREDEVQYLWALHKATPAILALSTESLKRAWRLTVDNGVKICSVKLERFLVKRLGLLETAVIQMNIPCINVRPCDPKAQAQDQFKGTNLHGCTRRNEYFRLNECTRLPANCAKTNKCTRTHASTRMHTREHIHERTLCGG